MSEQIKDGGPAFPIPLNPGFEFSVMGPADGMSLRDYFAAHIIQGMVANPSLFSPKGAFHLDNFASAWEAADAMLRAREMTP